jgi:phosphoribosyl-AMP cyclohydrolase
MYEIIMASLTNQININKKIIIDLNTFQIVIFIFLSKKQNCHLDNYSCLSREI